MRWFSHMPIKRKLTTVMLLACTLALALAGGAMIMTEWVTSRQAMVENMTVLADLLGRYSTAPLSFHREEDAEEVKKILETVQADPHILVAGLYDKDQRRFGEYVSSRGGAGVLPVQPPPDGYLFIGTYLELSHPVEREQKRIGTIYLRADLGRIYGQLRLHASIVVIVLAVTIVMVFVLSSGLRRPIAGPILALAGIARHVTEQKDYSRRATKQGADEIGALTDAFNLMLGEIEIRQRQITESINVLASSSEEILATSTDLASGAAQTATAIHETTVTLNSVRQTALTASQSAKSVAEGARAVVEISVSGRKSVEETIHGMEHVRRQVESIADSMVRLGEQTQTIGQIIASVEDLAVQSNVLAINASIEAARAGEQGKGFMVVAREVRNLAEQSKQATNQVRTILNEIRNAANAAVMATEQGSKAVEAGVKQSGQSGESIRSLSNSVTEAAHAATRIANSSQQQLAGTDQVASAMESIQQASNENAIRAKQLKMAAHDLQRLGEKLKQSLQIAKDR